MQWFYLFIFLQWFFLKKAIVCNGFTKERLANDTNEIGTEKLLYFPFSLKGFLKDSLRKDSCSWNVHVYVYVCVYVCVLMCVCLYLCVAVEGVDIHGCTDVCMGCCGWKWENVWDKVGVCVVSVCAHWCPCGTTLTQSYLPVGEEWSLFCFHRVYTAFPDFMSLIQFKILTSEMAVIRFLWTVTQNHIAHVFIQRPLHQKCETEKLHGMTAILWRK